VEAVVRNPGGELAPGLFATARIELPSARPSVVVPAAAVRTEAGVSTAFVVKNDRAELRLVQLGREVAGGNVEIVRGIDKGERVVARPVERLGDGSIVTVEGR